MTLRRPSIAISGCLLGEKIRYDGRDKKHDSLNNFIKDRFNFISFCPEVEMGLGIPRAPIELKYTNNEIHLVDVKDPRIDHTELALRTFELLLLNIKGASGIILTHKSPSCSLKEIVVTSEEAMTSKGLLANFLIDKIPSLPMMDSSDLDNDKLREVFFKRVEVYHKETYKV